MELFAKSVKFNWKQRQTLKKGKKNKLMNKNL